MDFNEMEYHVPGQCKCGCTSLQYKGLGEYVCAECGESSYDEYGLVRNYIESHKGASAPVIARETGVPIGTIRKMIEEQRFNLAGNRERTLQ